MTGTPMTGAIPSPHDYRDAYVSASVASPMAASAAMALALFLHVNLGDVLDQNKMPACVSHSIVYLMKLYWFARTGKWIPFSPRFLDILSSESWIPLDGGRVPRTVLKIAATYGCCTTAMLPNDTEGLTLAQYRDPSSITAAARAEALKYRIPGFIRIPLELSATRRAVQLFGAVSATFMVGNELWTPSWADKDIDPLRTPKVVVSGHQMTICGWKDAVLNTLRNQWSTLWGNMGEVAYDFQKWLPFTTEQWVIAQIPQDLVDFLKTLPSPKDFHFTWNVDLVQGTESEDVKFLQIALMILGFMDPVPAAELGIYGGKTAAAVAKFQTSVGISPVPSRVGPLTRGKLNSTFTL